MSRFLGYLGESFYGTELRSNLEYTKNGAKVDSEDVQDYFLTDGKPGALNVDVQQLELTGKEYTVSKPLEIHQRSGEPATLMKVGLSQDL